MNRADRRKVRVLAARWRSGAVRYARGEINDIAWRRILNDIIKEAEVGGLKHHVLAMVLEASDG